MAEYNAGDAGVEGSIRKAVLRIGDQALLCTDRTAEHAFGLTPAISLFVHCVSADEIAKLTLALSNNGSVLMKLDNYGFSTQFAWVTDRFGISWQLNRD